MSAVGEKAISETVSSGGFETATSFFKSPMVLLVDELAAAPNSPDILTSYRCSVYGETRDHEGRWFCSCVGGWDGLKGIRCRATGGGPEDVVSFIR